MGPRDEIFANWSAAVSQEASLTVDAQSCVLDANAGAAGVWGGTREDLRGKKFCELFTSPEAARVLYSRAMELGLAQGHFLDALSPDGQATRLLCRAERMKGRAKLVQVAARRIERVPEPAAILPDAALVDAGKKFRDAFDCANIGMALVDPAGHFLQANRKTAEIFGFSTLELESMHLLDLIYPGDDQLFAAPAAVPSQTSPESGAGERRFLHRNGLILFVDFSFAMVRDGAGNPHFIIASFRDVTESRRQEILLREQASLDPLTRALNRTRMEEQGKLELLRAERYGHKLSVAMVDLDHFKKINDTYGHAAGDLVLSGFAEICHGCLRLSDEMGRWGGEEFLILLPETGTAGAGRVSERLRASLEQFAFPGGICITASIGIAAFRKGEPFAVLVHRADAAMYCAKQGGRNRVVTDEQDLADDVAAGAAPRPLIQLQWKKSYVSGQAVIDDEHQELIQAANRLLAADSTEEGQAEISSLLNELVSETRTHFRHEEELLRAAQYSRYEEHREIHNKLLARVDKMMDGLAHGETSMGDVMGFVIHDLVARHILREDREFFSWVGEFASPAAATR
jgi:diguanylate cyclase (GGDEF)-like protein/hemerythrin-like metal-binding protein/PAS domain S-box-containing protein